MFIAKSNKRRLEDRDLPAGRGTQRLQLDA